MFRQNSNNASPFCIRRIAGAVALLLGAAAIYFPWVDSAAATSLVISGAGLLGLTTLDGRKSS